MATLLKPVQYTKAGQKYAGNTALIRLVNPLFFSSDIKGLGPVDPSQIEVIHATPNPGAQGFKMGALEKHRKELENLNRRKLEKINELNTLEKIRGQRPGIREQA